MRALIVIDIQEDYFPGGTLPLWQAAETEMRIAGAIRRAQNAGDRVVLVRHVSDAPAGLFARDGAGIAIRPAVLAAAGDAPVVTKRVADAFQETDLSAQLAGCDRLLVCGMMTQNCVAFTAMSDMAKAFRVSVVSDLCTAPTEIVHRIALNALASKRELVASGDLWG